MLSALVFEDKFRHQENRPYHLTDLGYKNKTDSPILNQEKVVGWVARERSVSCDVEGAWILQDRGEEWANPPQNTNGLIRQYFPKGTDFTQVSEDEINEVQRKLNDRP